MTSKAEVWQERLAACRASGLSTAAFCRRNDLPYAQFMYWQRKLGSARKGLVPIRVVTPSSAPSTARLSLDFALPGGVKASVSGAARDDVVAMIRALSC